MGWGGWLALRVSGVSLIDRLTGPVVRLPIYTHVGVTTVPDGSAAFMVYSHDHYGFAACSTVRRDYHHHSIHLHTHIRPPPPTADCLTPPPTNNNSHSSPPPRGPAPGAAASRCR